MAIKMLLQGKRYILYIYIYIYIYIYMKQICNVGGLLKSLSCKIPLLHIKVFARHVILTTLPIVHGRHK